MNLMIKRLLAICLAISMAFLSGCSLAKPEPVQRQDRLAGVLVTAEHLDLFDMEAYLNDQLNVLGTHEVSDTSGYEGRIYGELTPTGRYEDGTTKYEVSFPGVEGYFLVDLRLSASGVWEEGEEYYWCSTGNGGFYDVKSGFTATDAGEESSLEMTLAYWQEGMVTMFVNPIYQCNDGRIYVTSGSGLSGELYLGGEMTHTLNDTLTTTVDGESKTMSACVKVHAVHALPTKELQLIQMDETHRVIAQNTYQSGSFPEELTVEETAAYLIVQTTDGETVRRELRQRGDENAPYFTAQGPICVPGGVKLNWGE